MRRKTIRHAVSHDKEHITKKTDAKGEEEETSSFVYFTLIEKSVSYLINCS